LTIRWGFVVEANLRSLVLSAALRAVRRFEGRFEGRELRQKSLRVIRFD
jgi:hypothetical protein